MRSRGSYSLPPHQKNRILVQPKALGGDRTGYVRYYIILSPPFIANSSVPVNHLARSAPLRKVNLLEDILRK